MLGNNLIVEPIGGAHWSIMNTPALLSPDNLRKHNRQAPGPA
jgi:hypothetical protein